MLSLLSILMSISGLPVAPKVGFENTRCVVERSPYRLNLDSVSPDLFLSLVHISLRISLVRRGREPLSYERVFLEGQVSGE